MSDALVLLSIVGAVIALICVYMRWEDVQSERAHAERKKLLQQAELERLERKWLP